MATKQRKASKTKERAKKSPKSRHVLKDWEKEEGVKLDRYGQPHDLATYRKNHWRIPSSVYKVDEKRSQVIHKTNYGPLGRPPSNTGARVLYQESKQALTPKGKEARKKKNQVLHKKRLAGKKLKKTKYTEDYILSMGGGYL